MPLYSIGESIELFLNRSRIKNGVNEMKLNKVWENIVGKVVASYTEKINIYNKTLFITTNVAVLKTELSFRKEQLIKQVNEALGEEAILDIVLK